MVTERGCSSVVAGCRYCPRVSHARVIRGPEQAALRTPRSEHETGVNRRRRRNGRRWPACPTSTKLPLLRCRRSPSTTILPASRSRPLTCLRPSSRRPPPVASRHPPPSPTPGSQPHRWRRGPPPCRASPPPPPSVRDARCCGDSMRTTRLGLGRCSDGPTTAKGGRGGRGVVVGEFLHCSAVAGVCYLLLYADKLL